MTVNGSTHVDKDTEKMKIKPSIETHLSDLKLVLGPELKIVYPLILIFTVSGELELNGLSHPKCITPKGILVFENGEVELLATQVCVMDLFYVPDVFFVSYLSYYCLLCSKILVELVVLT
jgi:hypothetical protein